MAGGWTKLASDTLTGNGDNIVNTVMSKKFIQHLLHEFEESGTSALPLLRYNNNSNSVYADRNSQNGAADTTAINQTSVDYALSSLDTFAVTYLINISGQEKLGASFIIDSLTAGSGTAPRRREEVHKFVPSPDADITEIRIFNGDTGNFDTGSNLSTLGTDGTEVFYNIQNGAIFEETDTNKHYQYNSTTDTWTQIDT